MVWTVFNSIALYLGYFFTGILCVGIIGSIIYWLTKAYDVLKRTILTYSSKIQQNGYVYKVSYKNLLYDHGFVYGDYYDWFYVIERYPIKNKKQVEYLNVHIMHDEISIYEFEKRGENDYNVVRYQDFDTAKETLNEYLNNKCKTS